MITISNVPTTQPETASLQARAFDTALRLARINDRIKTLRYQTFGDPQPPEDTAYEPPIELPSIAESMANAEQSLDILEAQLTGIDERI